MAAEAGWETPKSRKSKPLDESVLARLEVEVPLPGVRRSNRHSFGTRSVLGHYSQDHDCDVHMDDREACEMAYTVSDDCREFEQLKGTDLKGDPTKFKWRVEGTEADGLKPVLKWILHKMSSDCGDVEVEKYMRPSSGEVTFVFKRSVMTRILNAPYEHHSEKSKWQLKVCRFQNIIYVCNDKTFIEWKDYSDKEKLRRYWAAKFESLITHPIQEKPLDQTCELGDCAGYAIVVGTQLSQIDQTGQIEQTMSAPKISFILSAKVDAEQNGAHTTNDRGGLPPAASDCIELSSAYVDSREGKNFLPHTLRHAWSRFCSVGTPSIVYGFHDEEGILQETETFRTDKLPDMCSQYWSDAVCLNFADVFTKWLEKSVKEEDPLREYTVTFEPIGSEKPKPRTTGRMLLRTVENNSECPSILTPEFVEEMSKRYGARS
eukprot:scpid30914/ scgid12900/ Protein Dom3Z; Dom-3 homolog Z